MSHHFYFHSMVIIFPVCCISDTYPYISVPIGSNTGVGKVVLQLWVYETELILALWFINYCICYYLPTLGNSCVCLVNSSKISSFSRCVYTPGNFIMFSMTWLLKNVLLLYDECPLMVIWKWMHLWLSDLYAFLSGD